MIRDPLVDLQQALVAHGWTVLGYGCCELVGGAASPTGKAIVWLRAAGRGGRVYLWTEARYDGPSVTIRRGSPRTAAAAIDWYARTGQLEAPIGAPRQAELPVPAPAPSPSPPAESPDV